MVYYIKGKPTEEELKKMFDSIRKARKGVNVRKYAGKVKAKGDPVALQRKLRDEWD